MNRKLSNRQNPFRTGSSTPGSNQQQQHDFKHESKNGPQSYNRMGNNSFNNHNNNRQGPGPQYSTNSTNNSQLGSYNAPGANNSSFSSPPQAQPQPLPRSGPCVLCKATTALICSRCGDFYCSPTCQKTDWQNHRFICFLMPKLVSSSVDIYQNIPELNGFQNMEISEKSPSVQSQNRKYVNNSSPTPSLQNHQQHQQQQQQQQQKQDQSNQKQQQQQRQRQQKQNQNDQRQNRSSSAAKSSVNGSEKANDPDDNAKATNIGKVEQSPFPKSNSAVLVTAIRSSNRVFLRSIEKEENDGYLKVMKAINEYGRNASPLKVMPTKNAFAITDFQNDGVFYRVQVISAKDENNIKVIYFDYGNESTKKLSELKDISMECAALKQHIVMATLKNVPFIKDQPKIIEYMKSFEDIEAKVVYNEREKPLCEIILDGVEDSLNKKVNLYIQESKSGLKQEEKQSKAPPKDQPKTESVKNEEKQMEPSTATAAASKQQPKSRPSQFSKAVMVPPFEHILLPIQARNVEVIVVDNSLLHYNCFACVSVEDKANLQEIQNYFLEYEDTGREYKPKIGEYCLGKYEGAWYRAKVLTILSTEVVEVVFIDFLNESEVFTKDTRRYPLDLDLPCKTTLCMIQGLPEELTERQVEYLKDKLQAGSQIKINEVVEKYPDDEDIAVCRINQVTQWMTEYKS